MNTKIVNIGKDFSRYPAGRYPSDGKFNGQSFRQKFLVEQLKSDGYLDIYLDDALDYGSSFLEEAFGGLVRVEGIDKELLISRIKLHSNNFFLIDEIFSYIKEASTYK